MAHRHELSRRSGRASRPSCRRSRRGDVLPGPPDRAQRHALPPRDRVPVARPAERYGPWSTVHSRFRRWTREGLWDRILAALQRELDAAGQIDWRLWCIDGSHVRAHRVAAGAGGKPARAGAPRRAADHALGAAAAGSPPSCTSSLTARAPARRRPQRRPGAREPVRHAAARLGARAAAPRGPAATAPRALAGDKGYSYPAIRAWLRRYGVRAVIPERCDQVARRAQRPGRKPANTYTLHSS
jgi:hypothetical protein